jgi:hypothetical protein
LQRTLEAIAGMRAQAEDARAYAEAQAAFAARGIRVAGILWAQDGGRVAMIDGEPHVLAIGDRWQDFSVAAIDSDRVVFRDQGRHHYEFTCYRGKNSD